MERNNTTINVSQEVRNNINQLKLDWKLKTHNDVLEKLIKKVKGGGKNGRNN